MELLIHKNWPEKRLKAQRIVEKGILRITGWVK
jgi:hypothetical protein